VEDKMNFSFTLSIETPTRNSKLSLESQCHDTLHLKNLKIKNDKRY